MSDQEESGGGRIPQGPDWFSLLIPILMVIAAMALLFYSNIVKTGLLR
jgi:hypothetical protein